jgi:hypothetical protein
MALSLMTEPRLATRLTFVAESASPATELAPGVLGGWGRGPCTLLSERFDPAPIVGELDALPRSAWGSAGRNPAVQTQVEAFFAYGSRRGPAGRIEGERDIFARLPVLRDLVYAMPAAGIDRVLVARLPARKFIPLHVDSLRYYSHSVRLVFPIATDPRARLFCKGRFWHFRAGEIWAFNNLYQHAAVNDGVCDRVHVLVDFIPNDDLRRTVTSGLGIEGERDDARLRRLEEQSLRRYAERRWHRLGYRVLEALHLR